MAAEVAGICAGLANTEFLALARCASLACFFLPTVLLARGYVWVCWPS